MTISLPDNLHEEKQQKRELLKAKFTPLAGKSFLDMNPMEKDAVLLQVLVKLNMVDEHGNLKP